MLYFNLNYYILFTSFTSTNFYLLPPKNLFILFQSQWHLQIRTHAPTAPLPSTLSPSNAPSDGVPVISPVFFLTPIHLAAPQQQGAAVNQRSVSGVSHQWYANEMFHVWDLMRVYPRPPTAERASFCLISQPRGTGGIRLCYFTE